MSPLRLPLRFVNPKPRHRQLMSSMCNPIPVHEIASPSGRSVIYTHYDVAAPPPRPSTVPSGSTFGSWSRFVCISDTHSASFQVPDGDVLLHSGDLSTLGRVVELIPTATWLGEMNHSVKMQVPNLHNDSLYNIDYGFHSFIAGNHDASLLFSCALDRAFDQVLSLASFLWTPPGTKRTTPILTMKTGEICSSLNCQHKQIHPAM